MKIIQLKLKDQNIYLNEEELDLLTVDEWYLTLQMKYLDLENENPTINLDEDYDIVKDILDSIKFRSLIITNQKKIHYYLKLGEKWLFPEWLMNMIQDKIKETQKIDNIKSELLELQECKNCKQIYKVSENHSEACQFHPGEYSVSYFTCCGYRPNNGSLNFYCCKSYHSSNKPRTLNFLEKYMKLFPEEINN